jgi:signal transduction histidine kinase
VSADTASISVTDTGRGVPKEKLEAIFEPFVQLGRSLSSAHEGMGLGLSISRDLARAMNGDLIVASKVGEGSTFSLILPRSF